MENKLAVSPSSISQSGSFGFRRRDMKAAITDPRPQRWGQHCQLSIRSMPWMLELLTCVMSRKGERWVIPFPQNLNQAKFVWDTTLSPCIDPCFGFIFISMNSSFLWLPTAFEDFFLICSFFVLSIIFWLMQWWGDWRKETELKISVKGFNTSQSHHLVIRDTCKSFVEKNQRYNVC